MTWDGLLEDLTDAVSDFFGQPVLYWREKAKDAVEIEAIFDPQFHSQEGGTVSVGSAVPILDIRDRDIGGPPAQGDRCEIAGALYLVSGVIPSTSGMTKAVLRRQR